MKNTLAFCHAFSGLYQTTTCNSFIHNNTSRVTCTKRHGETVRWTRQQQRVNIIIQAARRERIDPNDEAFVNCGVCGSDEIVSAEKLLSRGTLKVRCSQCRNEFVAQVATALSIDGTPLIEERKKKIQASDSDDKEEQLMNINEKVIKLYISGLSPKVDDTLLRETIQVYGQVKDVNIIYDRISRRPRGFAFVSVIGKKVAEAIIDDLSGSNILGSRLTVKEANE